MTLIDMKPFNRNYRAFTLVEMLVVIAILAIPSTK